MATTNSKIAAAKKLATKVKAKGKKKDYSPQNPPQSKVYKEVNDEQVPAKPVGYRWTTKGAEKVGANPNSRPSRADVENYKGKTFKVKGVSNRYVYQEKRVDKSDKSRKNKFQEGGTLGAGSFKDGGSVKQTKGQYAKAQGTSPSRSADKVHQAKPVGWRFRGNKYRVPSQRHIDQQMKLSPDERDIYYETRRDKSDKSFDARLEQGGTLGAGSFKDGGSVKQRIGQYAKEHGTSANRSADKVHQAKPVGWRYRGNKYREVSQRHIDQQLKLSPDERDIYYETRRDKSDKSFDARLEQGGTLGAGSFARGGSTISHYKVNQEIFIEYDDAMNYCDKNNLPYSKIKKTNKYEQGGTLGAGSFARGGKTSYRPQYIPNEDIASITLKSGKVIKNNSIYDGAYVSKSLKLQEGGTLGAGSFQDGGTLGAGSFARGGVERIANTQAREYTENLIPFKGNNLEGKTLDNGDYVVLSYGYYPIWWYCKKQGKWYGNSTKYSVTTSKQMSQSRPTYDATMLSKNDLLDMMMKHNSSFEDGGLLDNILSDTSVDATQNVGGTTFSQGSLTDNMDITNPNF